MAALFTKVSLRTSAEALLLCSSGTTFQTFFCSLFTSLNNYALNLMILKGNMGFSDPRFFYYATIIRRYSTGAYMDFACTRLTGTAAATHSI